MRALINIDHISKLCSFEKTTELFFNFFYRLLTFFLVLNVGKEKIVELLPNSIQRLLPSLQTLSFMLIHFFLIKQNLIFSIFVRIGILLVNHCHNVVLTAGFVRGSLVGIVVISSFDSQRLVQRSHHCPAVEVVECPMLKLSFLALLGD